jgi:hypothetical protein
MATLIWSATQLGAGALLAVPVLVAAVLLGRAGRRRRRA